jgi:hypothetical protein
MRGHYFSCSEFAVGEFRILVKIASPLHQFALHLVGHAGSLLFQIQAGLCSPMA